jgi:hypothetical protein
MSSVNNNNSNEPSKKQTKIINVGLEFKDKPFRKWLKEHYLRQDKSFNFKNSHYVFATVNQLLTFNLLNGMSEYFRKTNHGFYDVKVDDMITFIRLTPELNQTYNYIISRYDGHMDYQKQLCVDKKVFDEYITKNVFHDNFRINLNKQSMNFLTYLLVQTNILLANTAKQLAMFGNKKSISDSAIIHSLNIHFSGKLLDDILKKYDSVSTLLKNKDKEDSEKNVKSEKNNDTKEVIKNNDEENEENDDENAKSEVDSEDDKSSNSEDSQDSEASEEEPPKKIPTKTELKKKLTKKK